MKSTKVALLLPFIGLMLTACGTPIEAIELKKLALEGRRFSQDDFATKEKLDLSTVAILTEDKAVLAESGEVQCNGYCLRLLYSGEAKTVIVGNLNMPIFNLEAQKELIQKPSKIGHAHIGKLKAFTIEEGDDCPGEYFSESYDFLARDQNNKNSSYSVLNETVQNISAGLCLKSYDTDLSKANTLLEITKSQEIPISGTKNLYFVQSVRAYRALSNLQFQAIYQKTKVSSAVPSMMGEVFAGLGAARYVWHTTEDQTPPEIFTKELGIKFSNFEAMPIDFRKAANKLSNASRTLSSAELSIFENYTKLLAKRTSLDEVDKEIILRIIKKPNLSQAIFASLPAFKVTDKDTDFLGNIVFDEFLATRQKFNNTKEIDERSTQSQEWLFLSERLRSLADLAALLPNKAYIDNAEKYFEIMRESSNTGHYWPFVRRLSLFPYGKARPFLVSFAKEENGSHYTMLVDNLCHYGAQGIEFKPILLEKYLALNDFDKNDSRNLLKLLIAYGAAEEIRKESTNEAQSKLIDFYARQAKDNRNICSI